MKNEVIENNKTELVIYESQDGNIKLDINLENETVWLSLEQMTRLFGRDKSVISRHIKNIFTEEELKNILSKDMLWMMIDLKILAVENIFMNF